VPKQKNLIFAPSIKELMSDNALPILIVMVKIYRNMIPIGHARKDSIVPSHFTNLVDIDVLPFKDLLVPCAPYLLESYQSEYIACNIK